MLKQTYKKEYKEEIEELQRHATWLVNKKLVEEHNSLADHQFGYTLGMNEFADLTNEEFVHIFNGYRMQKHSNGSEMFIADPNIELPVSVDWRQYGYVTPVKNQGYCGSCWAFSSTGSLEGQHAKKFGTLLSLSEENLMDCSRSFGNHGCKGGTMDLAFRYIERNGGIDTEMSYPYRGVDSLVCKYNSKDSGATVTSYRDIARGSESALQSAVASVGPISVAIDASHHSFQSYKSGVYYEPICSSSRLDHGVLVVGYGTENGRDYFLVKNSWGTSWGENGYIKMSRNENNNCGIATQASYPLD